MTLRALGEDEVQVAVRDTGLGLTEAQQAQLFQPFNRLGREHSGIEGTGIGLTLSRLLAEQMGGRITLASRPGEGSEFSVVLRQKPPALHP
jgi:signal transduction histidine kinase